jgi:predicted enzyme related to lactoylglutathione lyase
MKRVAGIGGVFFKAKDPAALREWYSRHLGLQIEDWGGTVFHWCNGENPSGAGSTVWSVFEENSSCFGPGTQRFMFNFRVQELSPLLSTLRDEGCIVDDKTDESEFGKFGWVTDPEGNRVELWEPPVGE